MSSTIPFYIFWEAIKKVQDFWILLKGMTKMQRHLNLWRVWRCRRRSRIFAHFWWRWVYYIKAFSNSLTALQPLFFSFLKIPIYRRFCLFFYILNLQYWTASFAKSFAEIAIFLRGGIHRTQMYPHRLCLGSFFGINVSLYKKVQVGLT